MPKRYFRNRAILAKAETVYGTDAVPTGAANAMLWTNVVFNPSVGDEVGRDLVVPYMGHQGVILTGSHATISGECEIAGSGAAGTAPAWGPTHRACGMMEVIAAGVDAQYTPISQSQEAVSLYFNVDGVNHVLLGARGTYTFGFTPKQIPRWAYSFTGLLGTISDIVLPAVTLTGFKKPVPVNKANTTFSLHGLAGVCEGVTFDLGNQIEPRFLIGAESIEHVDRVMTGSAVMEAVLLAQKNWFAIADAHTTGALALQHGTTAGNIVKIDAPAVQIGRLAYGESQKIVNNTLPLMFTTVAGNDEFKITVK
ncbi:phage tail tube protein [Pararhizobium sp. A13]|uniref:phage tail tube protein n=1 Tax=Pararhizobium sp. A13 TaxID=3133975 RepID=UPI0032443D4E